MRITTFGIAAAIAASSMLTAGNASAQTDVKVYGVVDGGVSFINHAPGNLATQSSGNLYGSRIGFSGSENLGGGLKAIWVLEGGVSEDTGATLQGGRTYGRQALVGLQGDWGTVTLGRQNSLMIQWMKYYNTMLNANWSAKQLDPTFSDRLDNAVMYKGSAGPFDFATYYSFGYDSTKGGEVPGDDKAGREYGIGGQYHAGDFTMGLVYDQKNGLTAATSDNTDKHLTFGARYHFTENAEMLGGFLQRRQHVVGTPTARTNLYWLGMNYHVSGPWEVRGSVYHSDDRESDKDPSYIVTLVRYAFSKSTSLYLMNAYAINKDGSDFGVNGFDKTIAAGENQFGTSIGIYHKF